MGDNNFMPGWSSSVASLASIHHVKMLRICSYFVRKVQVKVAKSYSTLDAVPPFPQARTHTCVLHVREPHPQSGERPAICTPRQGRQVSDTVGRR